jgi:type II secretory pathway pseudopilin PulG
MKVKVLAAFVLTLFISGCATWPAGEDPKGKQLKEAAAPVIRALQQYRQQNGHYPEKLEDLVPIFLSQLPDKPGLWYNPKDKRVLFNYSPTWPEPGEVTCSTALENPSWACGGYI